MSTTARSPAYADPAPTSSPGFSTPNTAVRSACTTASWSATAPVSASTPEGRSTASTDASTSRATPARAAAAPRSATATTDAEDAVDHEVGLRDELCGSDEVVDVHHPTAGPEQRGGARLVVPVGDQQRVDARTARGEARAGVQSVAAVVARADEQHHPRAGHAAHDVAQHRAGLDRQRRRGARHQRALGQLRHGCRLDPAYRLDRHRDRRRPVPHDATCAGRSDSSMDRATAGRRGHRSPQGSSLTARRGTVPPAAGVTSPPR